MLEKKRTELPMSRVARIAKSIEAMFQVMDKHLADVAFPERVHLEAYRRTLPDVKAESVAPDEHDPAGFEITFYGLLESYHRLRSVWIAAGYLEVLTSCVEHAARLNELAQRRGLDPREAEAKDASEAGLRQVQSVFSAALQACRS